MTTEEILDRINQYLDQHISGISGSIHQEPYTGDLFKLFAVAYANRESAGPSAPCITSDGLIEAIGARSQQADVPEHYQKKIELLRKLGAMWKEWDYAWEMYPQLHRSHEA